ncbi:MAG: hypothetical protein AABW63_03800 [Nanoarchaeota archaeon]
MKKEVFLVLFIFSIISVSSLAAAAISNDSINVDKAYKCLSDQITQRGCDKLSSEEKIFSLLSVGKCRSQVISDEQTAGCWPSSSCDIKTTALALLALHDQNKAENWLLDQAITPPNLNWYLQIESGKETSCEITFSSGTYNVEFSEDKKILSSSGKCFSQAQDGYWLRISNSCIDEKFAITCDNDFLTNLIYQGQSSNVLYVSPETSSASANGETIEKINATCFGTKGCDYEGSLWAALALSSSGHINDVKNVIPYLVTNAEDNKKYLPDSFLYLLTSDADYRAQLLSQQNPQRYWLASSSNNKFYDTALALYPFSAEQDFTEKTNAKQWLFSTQNSDGCWENNIRNTAFILSSVWPRNTASGDGGGSSDCQSSGYFCRSGLSCSNDGGTNFSDYYCPSSQICCSVQEKQESCRDLNGTICTSSQTCEDGVRDFTASDLRYGESCCVGGTCKTSTASSLSDCELSGGSCQSSCSSGEDISNSLCTDASQSCCVVSSTPQKKSLLWVWILSILIVLALIGILFRNKLRLFFLRFKRSSSKGGPTFPPRSFPPPTMPMMMRRPMQRRILPPQQPASRKTLPVKPKEENKELDDVLKKLKDMGK